MVHMKTRPGFVSNSSSCSFCIGKNYMTKEQIEDFAAHIDEWDEEDDETFIFNEELYFQGQVGYGTEASITKWLKMNKLEKYASFQS